MNQRVPGSGGTGHSTSAPDPAQTAEDDQGGAREVAEGAREEASEVADAARARGREVTDSAQEQGRRVADAAREETRDLAETARGETREVAETARSQAREVAEEAAEQAGDVVDGTVSTLHEQARVQTHRVAESLHTTGDQLRALADGRPEDAGHMDTYARRAASQVDRVADRVDEMGFDGIVDEVQGFARRRPGAFLASAAAAGFAVGRLGRNRGRGDGR